MFPVHSVSLVSGMDIGLLKMQLDSELTQVKAIYNLITVYSDGTTCFVPGICWGQWNKGFIISYNIYSYIFITCFFFDKMMG